MNREHARNAKGIAFLTHLNIAALHRGLIEGENTMESDRSIRRVVPLLLEPQSQWAPTGERGGRHLALTELIQAASVFPVSRVVEAMELP